MSKNDEEGFVLVILKLLFDLKMCYTREAKEMHVSDFTCTRFE